MAALVAMALVQASDRTAWGVALVADRFGARAMILAGVVIAVAVCSAIAGYVGGLVAPMLDDDAAMLLFGGVLLSAGIAAIFPMKRPTIVAPRRMGGPIAAFMATLILSLGDRGTLIVLAVAARTDTPVFAAVGGTLGALAVLVPALLGGERARMRLPMGKLRPGIGGVLVVAGLIAALGAMRLI